MPGYDFDITMEREDGVQRPVARFRDPKAVEALGTAGDAVRTAFRRAGFRMEVSERLDTPGRYRAEEARWRTVAVQRVESGLLSVGGDVARLDWGGFSIDGFFYAVSRARPIDTPRSEAPVPRAARTSRLDTMPLARLDRAARPVVPPAFARIVVALAAMTVLVVRVGASPF